MSVVYIAGTLTNALDYADYMRAPADRVPSNITDPVKIRHRIDEMIAKDAVTAAGLSITGVLAAVKVHCDDPNIGNFELMGPSPYRRGQVATAFCNWLTSKMPGQFSRSLRYGETTSAHLVFGWDIHTILKVASFELLAYNQGQSSIGQVTLPVRLWHSPLGVYDPLDVLLSTSERSALDLGGVMRYCGISADIETLDGQLEATKRLVSVAQLAGQDA